jgi:hypothetical protein
MKKKQVTNYKLRKTYFFFVKTACLLGSVSTIDALLQSLVLTFLSDILLLCLLMCPLRALD